MRSAFALLSTAFVLYGCGSDDDTGVSPTGATTVTLTLSSPNVMASAGDTRSVTAVVRDGAQQVVTSPSLTWSSSASAVATVAESGDGATITAVGDGVATITATSGGAKGTMTVTVRRAVASVALTSPVAVLTVGSSVQLVATALDPRQNPIDLTTGFTYTSSNPKSLLVSATGLVSALFSFSPSPSATITATLTRDGVTASGSTEISVGVPLTFDEIRGQVLGPFR
jgi:trimeric autotransporter adhesin